MKASVIAPSVLQTVNTLLRRKSIRKNLLYQIETRPDKTAFVASFVQSQMKKQRDAGVYRNILLCHANLLLYNYYSFLLKLYTNSFLMHTFAPTNPLLFHSLLLLGFSLQNQQHKEHLVPCKRPHISFFLTFPLKMTHKLKNTANSVSLLKE